MFERGGSAVDASIAANAALCVVYGHMCGLGGDLFAQVWSPDSGDVVAPNGSGRAGERAAIEDYRARGLEKIPDRGPLGAINVPGAVDGWWELHQRFGVLDWSVLFAPCCSRAARLRHQAPYWPSRIWPAPWG
jgi:gamma-glutamyltranspeptidase/glutathione hydrolase